MQNNPNQEIHTGYAVNNVFTPTAANQLARTNHYDFVITQEMLDKYLEQHSGATTIDIGNLIASNIDGTNGSWTTRVKCPVSIYIAAKTSWNDSYSWVFGGRLISTGDGGILDCSDYKSGGNWDFSLTDGMVNVYSAYPYRLNDIQGGFNFWSTPQSAVFLINGAPTSGKVRIGSYGTGAIGINLSGREDVQVICQQCVSGTGFICERGSAGTVPSVVYANWMGGEVADKYRVAVTDTVKYGVYEQASVSVALGSSPVVVEEDGTKEFDHVYAGKTASSLSFFNGVKGQNLILYSNGNIGRSFIGGAGSNEIVIEDVDSPLNISDGDDVIWPALSLFKDGVFETTHSTVEKIFIAPDAGTPSNGLDIGNSCHIKWYTWSHIAPNGSSEISNTRTTLYIKTESMIEGLVYELDCYATSANTTDTADGITLSPRQEGAPRFQVRFMDGYDQIAPYRWASYQNLVSPSNTYVDLNFKKDSVAVDKSDSTFDYGNAPVNQTYPILARAKLMFVMLGGNLYVMAY